MSTRENRDPSDVYRRAVEAALEAAAVVRPPTPDADVATLRACGLWPWTAAEVTWWCDDCRSLGCASCAGGAVKPTRTQLVAVAGIGAHDLRRAVAIAGRFGATKVVTIRVLNERQLRGLGGPVDGHRPPSWYTPEQRGDWPFQREMARIGAHFFGVHREGENHGNVILAVVDYAADVPPHQDPWAPMAGVVDGARWRRAVTTHGQAALFEAIDAVAACGDLRKMSGDALAAIGGVFAKAIRRRLLLASLEHHRWDMVNVADDFGMSDASHVLREIADVGLERELERARQEGLVRRGACGGRRASVSGGDDP